MIFQKVYCYLLSSKHCHPHLCICWCHFLQPERSHLCWKSLLTSLQYILTVLISVLLTHVCLFVSLSASAAVSVVAPDLPSFMHCPPPQLSAQAQQGSALIPNTLLIPAFLLYPCVLPAWKVLFILFQVLQPQENLSSSRKSSLIALDPDVCCPSAQVCSGLLLSGQIFSHSWVLYAPTKPASCLTRRVGVVASIPWGSLQLTVMHVALLSIRLSSKDAQSRPGHCHHLSILQGLPSEAACKRQFPSPVVAKGRSRLQLVHTVDHQFRRPGTEAHV